MEVSNRVAAACGVGQVCTTGSILTPTRRRYAVLTASLYLVYVPLRDHSNNTRERSQKSPKPLHECVIAGAAWPAQAQVCPLRTGVSDRALLRWLNCYDCCRRDWMSRFSSGYRVIISPADC